MDVARIAVVNDDAEFLSLMAEVMRDEGHEVIVCHEGGQAFGVVKRELPDIVFIDIRMEAPDAGWTISELLTLDPQTAGIPIVVCSANLNGLRDKRDWLTAHSIGTLPKPFDLDDLDRCIEITLQSGTPPVLGLEAPSA
jgi:CheY-like chemotaxis protein